MKAKTSSRLLLLLPILVACGCKGGNDFVGPITPTPSLAPTPTPAPAAVDLTGAWSGTITIKAAKLSGEAGCQARPITGTVSQEGGRVSGHFQSDCAGQVRLDASLSAGQLTGSIASGFLPEAGGSFSVGVSNTQMDIVTTASNELARTVILHLSR